MPNQSLFLPILFHEMKYASQSLKDVTYAKESNIVFCLETNDIDISTNDNEVKDDLADYIRSFKSMGFNTAIALWACSLRSSLKQYSRNAKSTTELTFATPFLALKL